MCLLACFVSNVKKKERGSAQLNKGKEMGRLKYVLSVFRNENNIIYRLSDVLSEISLKFKELGRFWLINEYLFVMNII